MNRLTTHCRYFTTSKLVSNMRHITTVQPCLDIATLSSMYCAKKLTPNEHIDQLLQRLQKDDIKQINPWALMFDAQTIKKQVIIKHTTHNKTFTLRNVFAKMRNASHIKTHTHTNKNKTK